MKKPLLLFLAVSGIVLTSVAQPTLTSATTTPLVGESFPNQYVATAGVGTGSAGANQMWDFSTLTDSGTAFILQAVTPSSTPYADSFPTSNLTIKTANDSNYIYFNSQTSALNELGVVASNEGSLKYAKPKVYLPYPFTFGSFFTDSVVEASPAYNVVLRGKDSLYGDAWGTLYNPSTTYLDVLRVKYIENVTGTRDTLINYNGIPINATVNVNIRTTSYLYFSPSYHAPLLTYEQTNTHITATILGIITVLDSSISTKDIYYLKNNILPISFVSFKAALTDNKVSLQWQTAQETNAGNFTLQRSLTGSDFSDIADVKATGKSTGAHYVYADQSFVKTAFPPSVYYRIKETDKDGKEFFSSIAVLHSNAASLSVYPNPATSYINLNIQDVIVVDAITLYDAKGRIVQQLHDYPLSKQVNVTSLSKGTYFMQVKIKDKTITTTVIKQ